MAATASAQQPAASPAAAILQEQQAQVRADLTFQSLDAPAQVAATPAEVQALHTALRARLADLRH